MRHTESDLRRLLTERIERQAGHEPPARLEAIVRRGRHTRRARRTVTAGTAILTVAAAGWAYGLLPGPLRPDGTTVAQHPADSARIEAGPELPEKFPVELGGKRFDLTLLHSQRFGTMGAARTVTFTPTSHYTGHRVVCDDPRSWVVTRTRLKGGESGGAAGRCMEWLGGHHDQLSAPSGWLERPQSLRVWVFPADAPIWEVKKDITGCRPSAEPEGCDESALTHALMDAKVRERLSALVGERPGGWAVGIYDRPAGAGATPDAGRRTRP